MVQFLSIKWLHDNLSVANAYNAEHGFIEQANVADADSKVIDLNFLPHAVGSLLGGWKLQLDGTLIWHKGILITALEDGYRDLLIKNIRPLDNTILNLFKKIRDHQLIKLTDGRFYQIPKDLIFNWTEDLFVLEDQSECIEVIYKKTILDSKNAELLTLERLTTMVQNYEFTEGQCDIQPGWLVKYNNTNLNVNVPLTISVEAWYYFLKQCNLANVKVTIYAARGVKLPSALKKFVVKNQSLELSAQANLPNLFIYHSSDPDVTLHSLPEKYRHNALIISADEHANLEDFAIVEATKAQNQMLFIQHHGNIAKFFSNNLPNNTLIIKGTLTRQWIDLLSEYILTKKFKGVLIIINQTISAFPFLADQHDIISVTRKKHYLLDQGYNNIDGIPSELLKSLPVADIIKLIHCPEEISKYLEHNVLVANEKVMDLSFAANNVDLAPIKKSS
jgi:hypothetical protein